MVTGWSISVKTDQVVHHEKNMRVINWSTNLLVSLINQAEQNSSLLGIASLEVGNTFDNHAKPRNLFIYQNKRDILLKIFSA